MKYRRIHIARFLIITAMALAGCYLGLTPGRTAGADSAKKATLPLPELRGPEAIRHLEQQGLYDSLSAAVRAARYRVEARKGGGYEASNPEQDYRTIFTPEGVEVRGSSRTGRDWRLGMKLSAYGYGERKKSMTAANVKGEGDRIEYERRARDGGALSEWYVNRATGLEQGFTIPQAPGKRRAGERLNLWLKLSGDLNARLAESGQVILLNGRGAGAGLRYDKLHAFDATGKELDSRMKLSGGQVILEVMDEAAIYPLTIDPTLAQQAKLTASDPAESAAFGGSVAISGDTAVVGAPDEAKTPGPGSAYVFVRSGTSWSQQQKLTASDGAAGDSFGDTVGISADTVVVGAVGDDTAAGFVAGSAYVFVRSGTSWSEQAKLTASDAAAFDRFGSAVGISADTVVVGAESDDTAPGSDTGSAYVFVRSGTSWSEQQKLTAGDAAAGDNFGFAVGISADSVVVGAPFDDTAAGANAGSAYVFVRSGTSWSQQAQLTAGDAATLDQFGAAVGISADSVVVGARFDDTAAGSDAGSAYVFVRSGTSWSEQQKLTAGDAAAGDQFGQAVAISGDTVVVGASRDDTAAGSDAGSAYVFARSGTSWSQQQKLTASDAAASDFFGFAVGISADTVVVGAPNDDDGGNDAGSAYVFAPVAGYGSSPAPGSEINVGSATVGSSTSADLSVSETGDATLQVTSHSLSGSNAADFSVSPATLTIPDGGGPQKLAITCTPGATGARTAILTVNHNAPDSPATYSLTCTGLAAGDPYADAVAASALTLNPANAVGAPDGKVATVISALSIGSLTLDMGAGEEGTGNLKVHYRGLSAQVLTTVDFLDADGDLIASGQLSLTDLSAGSHSAVVNYSASPTPYRFVRLRGVLLLSFGVDAVEALAP